MVNWKESENGSVEPPPPPDQQHTGDVDVADSKSKRSPAFQFYPKEFLSSSKVMAMSMTERGIYITLLATQWLDGHLPADHAALARLVGVPLRQFERMWPHNLDRCFVAKGDRLVNVRLEQERTKQALFRRRQSDAAASRWDKSGDATASERHSRKDALHTAISDLQSPNKKEEEVDRTPVAMTFGTVGKEPTWDLTEGQIASWQAAYPNVRVADQCRRADIWLKANPDKRKTPQGMPRFLVNWLNKAVERGPVPFAATGTEGRGRTGAPPKGKYDGLEES